jgi:hypothetical protein
MQRRLTGKVAVEELVENAVIKCFFHGKEEFPG